MDQRFPKIVPSPTHNTNRVLSQKERYILLKKKWWLLTDNRKKAKVSVMNCIYYNNREIEQLINMKKTLEEEIKQLKKEIEQLNRQLDQQEIEYESDGFIRVAPFEALIDFLFKDFNFHTAEFQTCFILTYRTFSTTETVLQALFKSYQSLGPIKDTESVNKRFQICTFLKKWTQESWNDFVLDPGCVPIYEKFLEEQVAKWDPKLYEALRNTLLLKRENKPVEEPPLLNPPKPLAVPPKITSVLEIDPLELARQMTIVDFNLYKQIQHQECLKTVWNKPDKVKRAPFILQMTQRFNKVNKWVVLSLVKELDPAKRTKLVQYFLVLVTHLLDIHNFHAAFMINGAFYNSAVARLKAFRSIGTSKKHQKMLDDLRKLFDPAGNRNEYRTVLHSANTPCLPFLGVYQSDLTFIEDGNPDRFANGWINLKKNRLNANVILDLKQFQQISYNFIPLKQVQDWLEKSIQGCDEISDKYLYEISLKTEPRPNQ